ncbi:MAG: hypothetical protein GX558_10265, partial [Clostridiales bacterium]|nr:hypothetical protein [Clostridiales bacterium]
MRTNWVRNARAVAIGLLLIAVCWYANALFDHLPVAGRTFDVSPQGLTKLSDETAAVLKNLDRDVTIGVVASG